MASLVLGWRMPYLLSCFNVTGQSMLVPNEIALIKNTAKWTTELKGANISNRIFSTD